MALTVGTRGLDTAAYAPRLVASVERLRTSILWLLIASSSIVLIEPAPYDVILILAFAIFALAGLKFPYRVTPLLVLVVLFNLGGAVALLPLLDKPPSVTFVVVSLYLGISAVAFANIIAENTQSRLEIIRKAWIFSGLIASVCGILGCFGIAPELFTLYGRATGTFKDPNVFGPFVAVPAVLIVQGFMTGSLKRPILSLLMLLVLLGGVFFSFSRGAWALMGMSALLTGGLLFVTTQSSAIRARIVIIALFGLMLLAIVLAMVLSIDSVRELFELRFALAHDYDTGPRGRFGKIPEAILFLLDRPNGVGPLRFTEFFAEAPHNVFVNAFSSYGWLGGLSYLCLIAATLRIGWSTVWRRTPWQSLYIALWSATFCQILQGFQIDTDHWRHLWLLIGLTWGLGAAACPKPAAHFLRRARAPA
jgi:hypothetical protein